MRQVVCAMLCTYVFINCIIDLLGMTIFSQNFNYLKNVFGKYFKNFRNVNSKELSRILIFEKIRFIMNITLKKVTYRIIYSILDFRKFINQTRIKISMRSIHFLV